MAATTHDKTRWRIRQGWIIPDASSVPASVLRPRCGEKWKPGGKGLHHLTPAETIAGRKAAAAPGPPHTDAPPAADSWPGIASADRVPLPMDTSETMEAPTEPQTQIEIEAKCADTETETEKESAKKNNDEDNKKKKEKIKKKEKESEKGDGAATLAILLVLIIILVLLINVVLVAFVFMKSMPDNLILPPPEIRPDPTGAPTTPVDGSTTVKDPRRPIKFFPASRPNSFACKSHPDAPLTAIRIDLKLTSNHRFVD